MMDGANSTATHITETEREAAAMAIWNHEKGTAATVIVVSWLFKVPHSPSSLKPPLTPP